MSEPLPTEPSGNHSQRDGLCYPERDCGCTLTLGEFEGQGVSIIIPACEDTPRLRRAIWSIRNTADLPYQLIVSLNMQSVARNRNAGLDRATQDLVVFMDDDVILPAGWLSRLVAVLAGSRDIGAVSAQLSFPDGAPQTRRHDLAPGELWEVTIPGTCFVYSRRRVKDIRFDGHYQGSQWEDTDWMKSVQKAGLRTVLCGDVQVVHDHAGTQIKWLQENKAYFVEKWGELPSSDDICAVSPEQFALWKRPPLPGLDT